MEKTDKMKKKEAKAKKTRIVLALAALLALVSVWLASFASATVYAGTGELAIKPGDAVLVDSHKIVFRQIEAADSSGALEAKFDVFDTDGNKVQTVLLGEATSASAFKAPSEYKAPTFRVKVTEIESTGIARISVASVVASAAQADQARVAQAPVAIKVTPVAVRPGVVQGVDVNATSAAKPGEGGGASIKVQPAQTSTADSSSSAAGGTAEAVTRSIMIAPQTTFKLARGWNMVSVAFAQTTTTTCDYKMECPACVNSVPACAAPCRSIGPKLWHYDAASARYDGPGFLGSAVLTPGLGYWVYAKNECEMTIQSAPSFAPYFLEGVQLKKDWNQVGGPSHATLLNEIAGNCDVRAAWAFDAGAGRYVKASVLEPGKAYFVRVTRDCTLGLRAIQENVPALPADSADWVEDAS